MKGAIIGLLIVCFFIAFAMWACCAVNKEDDYDNG